jgi:hypothetical protein
MRYGLQCVAIISAGLIAGCASPSGAQVVRARPERWLLSYDGTYQRSAADEDFYVRAFTGIPGHECRAGLFSGVIFLGVQNAVAGRWYAPWANKSTPTRDATLEDWFAYVDTLATVNGPFARLDRAAARIDGRSVDIVVMIPALMREPSGAVRIAARSVDVATDSGRAIYMSYLDSLRAKFRRGGFTRLRLRGAYWLRESAWGDEATIARQIASVVHARGLQFFWIPYYGAGGVADWRSLGFDAAWLQPNYFLRPELTQKHLDSALAVAKSYGMGLEIEMDGRLFSEPASRARLADYLDAVAQDPTLPIALYDGGGTLVNVFRDTTQALDPLRTRIATTLCR